MNVLAALLGGTAILGGVTYIGVKGSLVPPLEPICAYPGDLFVLKFATSREVTPDDVGALQWEFGDYFPGTVEGIAAVEPQLIVMNVAMTQKTDFYLGAVAAFSDIVLQLVSIQKVEVPPAVPTTSHGEVYA